MPGTRNIVDKILARSLPDLKSMVMCFEDAVPEGDLPSAERSVLNQLDRLAHAINVGETDYDNIPLIFLRVRSVEQFRCFAKRLSAPMARVLSGFVFPKFYSSNAVDYFEQLQMLGGDLNTKLYGMPILEGRAIAHSETRLDELLRLRECLNPFRDLVLNIRVGGTDFSSVFGVRRGINSSIYDILPVRDILSEVLNFFNRADDGFTISAPVWEYFLAYKKDDIGRLLEQDLHRSLLSKQPILNDAIDGLLREVLQDKSNGFVGKTVIHPSHLKYVNAMQAVTLEEYEDALQIISSLGGVAKSVKANKMNEANPHRNWANRVALQAKAYGVIENECEYMQLFMDGAGRIN